MKRLPAVTGLLALALLAGCQHTPTLEEARALCTQQGGLLVVIYSQEITRAGVGKEIASPGDCVSPDKLGIPAPASPQPPAN